MPNDNKQNEMKMNKANDATPPYAVTFRAPLFLIACPS